MVGCKSLDPSATDPPVPPFGLSKSPNACDHLVQAYTDDAFLASVVTQYLGQALAAGEGAVLVATPAHGDAITTGFRAGGVDVDAAIAAGRLLILDADLTLGRFMRDGLPDRAAFFEAIGGALAQVQASGCPKIRVFGEMVDLLWPTNLEGTLRLEALWNELLTTGAISLLCAYRFAPFDRNVQGILHHVSRCHSRLMPEEDATNFENAVDRAYDEIFGAHGGGRELREELVSRHASPAMSRGQAALFAIRELSPALAAQVVERARHYYTRGSFPTRQP